MATPKQYNGPLGDLYQQKGENTTVINATGRTVNCTASTKTVSESESGATFLCNRAGGIAFTLPAIQPGLKYRFFVLTTFTGTATITAASGDLLAGNLLMVDTDTSNTTTGYRPDISDDLIITLNGGTTGGLVGTDITIEAVGKFGIDGRWIVSGVNNHNSNVATPFS